MTAAGSRQLFEGSVFSIIQGGEDGLAREAMCFKYISFDWLGAPGWFFWPRERKGVYFIKEQSACGKGLSTTARFFLYYYPHPDEEVFADYSLAEQLVRVSNIFSSQGVRFFSACSGHGHCDCEEEPFKDLRDGKGIPVPEARESLSASLFWIGSLTMRWRQGEWRSMSLEAPRRSRSWAISDVAGPTAEGLVMRAGDIDRNVPSWDLARFFVAALAHDYCLPFREIRRDGDCEPDAMNFFTVVFDNVH